jgi:sugar lactone lactonase YvrE
MIKKILLVLVVLIALLVGYLLFWPVPISPQAWSPPPAPALSGPYQQNNALATVEKLSLGEGFAPEDVAIDADNRVYAGMDDGRIVRLQIETGRHEVFANTHGRPLGLVFDSAGNLIVADTIKGLLSISKDGAVTPLTREADGVPINCANDLDIAANGKIYFTDASSRFPMTNYKADLVEHRGSGRLLAYDPKTRTTQTLLSNLSFANGVAVSPDQTFVLAVETGEYTIHRVWLTGPKAGQAEIFIDNLPGFPDGISSNRRDKFWLALVTPRDQTLDKLLPHPFLRKAVMRLPKFLQPAPKRYAFVLGLDNNGKVVSNFQDGSPTCYAQVANAVEHKGSLYFGSIGESTVGRFRLPTP